MDRIEFNINTGQTITIPIPIEEQPPLPTAGELMAVELSAVSLVYRVDLATLNTNFLAVLAADGVNEEAKKLVVRDEIAARKATYLADMAAVKAKYQ